MNLEQITAILQIIEKMCPEYQLPYITIFQDRSGTVYATNIKKDIEDDVLFSFGKDFGSFYEKLRQLLAE